jgi:hypothetical protein
MSSGNGRVDIAAYRVVRDSGWQNCMSVKSARNAIALTRQRD